MKRKNLFLTVVAIVVYMFLLAPLVIITGTAFGKDSFLRFPPKGFTLKWVQNIFNVEMFIRTFYVSIKVAVIATTIAMIIGIPVAYVLSRFDFKGKSLVKSIFITPVIVPGIVLGFSLMNFLIIKYDLPVFTSLLLGHIVIILPYIIRVISSSLESFDYSIEEAAISLGCNQIKAFCMIVLPNITSGVLAGFILAFINSFNNVPMSIFLIGPGVSTLPIQMMSYVEYYFDPTIAALSVVLMIITAVLMFIVERTLGLNFFTK